MQANADDSYDYEFIYGCDKTAPEEVMQTLKNQNSPSLTPNKRNRIAVDVPL